MEGNNPVSDEQKLTRKVPKWVFVTLITAVSIFVLILLLCANIIPLQDFKTGTKGHTNALEVVFNHGCPAIDKPTNWAGNQSMGRRAVSCSDQIHYGEW